MGLTNMLVISDTSAITNLIQLGELDLLAALFDEIVIPTSVYNELADYELQQAEIDKRSWILVEEVTNQAAVSMLIPWLDVGEAEAIILAKEKQADILIIDERKGRQVAEDHGLRIMGLLGILVRGKKKGYLTVLKPALDQLIQDIGFRVSQKLYEQILAEVDESAT